MRCIATRISDEMTHDARGATAVDCGCSWGAPAELRTESKTDLSNVALSLMQRREPPRLSSRASVAQLGPSCYLHARTAMPVERPAAILLLIRFMLIAISIIVEPQLGGLAGHADRRIAPVARSAFQQVVDCEESRLIRVAIHQRLLFRLAFSAEPPALVLDRRRATTACGELADSTGELVRARITRFHRMESEDPPRG